MNGPLFPTNFRSWQLQTLFNYLFDDCSLLVFHFLSYPEDSKPKSPFSIDFLKEYHQFAECFLRTLCLENFRSWALQTLFDYFFDDCSLLVFHFLCYLEDSKPNPLSFLLLSCKNIISEVNRLIFFFRQLISLFVSFRSIEGFFKLQIFKNFDGF